jgi:DNA-binding GntR family transcriptional regulator
VSRRRSLRPIERAAPLRSEVYAKVREAIVDGTLAPGSALVSTELAGRLGVSRTPVREAIARLIQDGLAVDEGGGRAVVRPISRQEIADFFEIRAALEAVAARRAVERQHGRWLPRLRAAEERLEAARREAAGPADGAVPAHELAARRAFVERRERERQAAIALAQAQSRRVEDSRASLAQAARDHEALVRAKARADRRRS